VFCYVVLSGSKATYTELRATYSQCQDQRPLTRSCVPLTLSGSGHLHRVVCVLQQFALHNIYTLHNIYIYIYIYLMFILEQKGFCRGKWHVTHQEITVHCVCCAYQTLRIWQQANHSSSFTRLLVVANELTRHNICMYSCPD